MPPLRSFVIGLGQMGMAHALAYHDNPGFEIAADRSMHERPAIGL